MRVELSIVIVDVRRADAWFQHPVGGLDTFVHVGVSDVETYIQVHVGQVEERQQPLGAGEFVGCVFEQKFHAPLLGEDRQVFQGRKCGIHLAFIKLLLSYTEVLDEVLERHGFGDLDGALDLVTHLETDALYGLGNRNHRMWTGTSPHVVRIHRRVQRVNFQFAILEPVPQLANLSAVPVIEVLPSAKNLHLGNAGVPDAVQPYGGQAVIDEKMRRKGALHVDKASISQTRGLTNGRVSSDWGASSRLQMRFPQLRHLSQSTVDLLGKLRSWRTLNLRWIGGLDTAALLDQIGAADEALAIPHLISFGLVPDERTRIKARSTIHHLFSLIPMEALPILDVSLRQSWAHMQDLYGMLPTQVANLCGNSEADRLFLALMTCHRSGYVRAEAIGILGTYADPISIPFLLIRLVDWVKEVRAVAETAFIQMLNVRYADTFVDCLGLVARLSSNSRSRPDCFLQIDRLLKLQECAGSLTRGIHSSSREVRRHCYQLAAENSGFSKHVLIREALLDSDVIVRKWAFTVGQELLPADRSHLMLRASKDPYGPIRRIALDATAASASAMPHEIKGFLLDSSRVIRWEAQSLLSARFGQSPAKFYREELQLPARTRVAILLNGLRETGDRSDLPLILGFLGNRSAKVRRAVIQGIRGLGVESHEKTLMTIVSADAPSVAREATSALLAVRIAPEMIWGEALKNVDQRVRPAVLKDYG